MWDGSSWGRDVCRMGTRSVGTAVKEFRGAVVRPFLAERLRAGGNSLAASGYSGQTVENFGASAIQEVVG